jgi:hypothetical protein
MEKRINMKVPLVVTGICAVLALGNISCKQWRVSELKEKKMFTLPIGEEQGSLSLQYGKGDILNVTFFITMSYDNVYCADNKMQRLQVFDPDGDLKLVIDPKKVDKTSNVKKTKFSFGIIGEVVADADGKIYVQNRLIPSEARKRKISSNLDISPSYLLVFDREGILQYTLGQRGISDLPFYYIDNLFTDNQDRLFVITKTFETWSVYRFVKKKRDFYVNFAKKMFIEKEGDDEYLGIIENIKVFHSGEKLLLSVAFYHNTRFKYRKIIEYNVHDNTLGKTILHLPDPKNELFALLDDKYILLWDVEERDVRFVIWNFQGNIINNLRIQMKKKKADFEQIFIDEKGHFYTYSVTPKGVELEEWE